MTVHGELGDMVYTELKVLHCIARQGKARQGSKMIPLFPVYVYLFSTALLDRCKEHVTIGLGHTYREMPQQYLVLATA